MHVRNVIDQRRRRAGRHEVHVARKTGFVKQTRVTKAVRGHEKAKMQRDGLSVLLLVFVMFALVSAALFALLFFTSEAPEAKASPRERLLLRDTPR